MNMHDFSRGVARLFDPRSVLVPAGLVLLAIAAGWSVATLDPLMSIGLMGGAAAGVLWLIRPDLALYALILLCPFTMSYRIAGVRGLQPHDLVLFVLLACAVSSLLAGNGHPGRFQTTLGKWLLGIWIGLAVWGAITYLLGPANQAILGSWTRNSWSVYRIALRPLLPFPIFVLLLKNRMAARRALDVVIAIGAVVAAYGFYQAETAGIRPIGPFEGKNALGGFLILILPFTAARLMVLHNGLLPRLMYLGIVLMTMRVIWLTGSRGAFVALIASLLPLAFLIPSRGLVAAATVCLVAGTLVLVVKQDILERPRVQRYLTLQDPTKIQNFQWRLEQWNLVSASISKRPLMGTGSEIDSSLISQGRLGTAHNSYLGLALRSGIPMAAAWLGLIGFIGVLAWRRALEAREPEGRSLWVGVVTFLAALLVHTNVDNTLLMPQVQYLFWIITSIVVVEATSPRGPLVTSATARASEA